MVQDKGYAAIKYYNGKPYIVYQNDDTLYQCNAFFMEFLHAIVHVRFYVLCTNCHASNYRRT